MLICLLHGHKFSQKFHIFVHTMAIQVITPREELQDIVSRFWYTDPYSLTVGAPTIRIMANGAPGIIFHHADGRSAVLDPTGSPLPVSFIYGQRTFPCLNHVTAHPFVFGVDLHPDALRRLFGLDAALLTNALLDLEDLLGVRINDRLFEARTNFELVEVFSDLLISRRMPRHADPVVDESIRLIVRNTGLLTPGTLSRRFNLSARQFQRRFKTYVGVCPETYLRIARFQRAIHLLQQHPVPRLTDIGYRLGYTDQSYFIREFRYFSGLSPRMFLRTLNRPQPFSATPAASASTLRIIHD